MRAYVTGAVYLPRTLPGLTKILSDLSVTYRQMGSLTPVTVEAFRQGEKYVGVPRDYGMNLISKRGLVCVDRMARGTYHIFPKRVSHAGRFSYQKEFVQEILKASLEHNDFMVHAATGKGKCLAKGTPVLMYDGRTLPVERVRIGDLLMGPDSTPRAVLSLANGKEEMFTVSPVKGESYTVNRSHILSLRITGLHVNRVVDVNGRVFHGGDIVDISVDDYLASSPTFRHCAKGWRVGVEFPDAMHQPIPPYILGTWLGDGSSRYATLFCNDEVIVQAWREYAASVGMSLPTEPCFGVGTYRVTSGGAQTANPMMRALRELGLLQNKHIPFEYLTGSREERLALLAGLVDTDGCVSCGCFDLVFVRQALAEDTAYLARSLGFAAYVYPCKKQCCNNGVWGDYFRIRISGDISEVPCRVRRKKAGLRTQKKNVLNTGITVSAVGVGEYYGFTISGDGRFLLGDFTVTHNTVCALSVVEKRGVSALVVVDQHNLMQQWVKECMNTLGLTRDQIGIVQGSVCDYEGKHVTIAMMQTLVSREYPADFYKAFGTVVFDECHTCGAPTFSTALLMFHAEVRFGVSATIDRRDALQKVIHWNIGKVAVSLLDKHDTSLVYYLTNYTVYSWYANISPKVGRMITEVSDDAVRNNLLVKAIKWMYEEDRDTLVISDRVEQLENLITMCHYAGIPLDSMGLYCGVRTSWEWVFDPTPARRPYGYVKGTDYSPVEFRRVRKRANRKQLASILATKKILFATFGMFAKGVDLPRLSAGVDCTPRSRAQQVHGRILRVLPDKPTPIWVTVRDVNSYKLESQFLGRVDEYLASSAEIYEWKPDKGVRLRGVSPLRREIRENILGLKAQNIITSLEGVNTLVTPSMPRSTGRRPETRTGKSTR